MSLYVASSWRNDINLVSLPLNATQDTKFTIFRHPTAKMTGFRLV